MWRPSVFETKEFEGCQDQHQPRLSKSCCDQDFIESLPNHWGTISLTQSTVFRYNLVFFLVTYLLPMVGMILCYLQMGVHLWRGDTETMSTIPPHPAMVKSRQNKKRVSKSKTKIPLMPMGVLAHRLRTLDRSLVPPSA